MPCSPASASAMCLPSCPTAPLLPDTLPSTLSSPTLSYFWSALLCSSTSCLNTTCSFCFFLFPHPLLPVTIHLLPLWCYLAFSTYFWLAFLHICFLLDLHGYNAAAFCMYLACTTTTARTFATLSRRVGFVVAALRQPGWRLLLHVAACIRVW